MWEIALKAAVAEALPSSPLLSIFIYSLYEDAGKYISSIIKYENRKYLEDIFPVGSALT